MRAVGYRQLWAHLDGEYGLAEAERRGIFATRQLAKRQLTWMRSEQSLAVARSGQSVRRRRGIATYVMKLARAWALMETAC